jgi:hypothetical protein
MQSDFCSQKISENLSGHMTKSVKHGKNEHIYFTDDPVPILSALVYALHYCTVHKYICVAWRQGV